MAAKILCLCDRRRRLGRVHPRQSPQRRRRRHASSLLEAGGWDRDPWIKIPLGWGRILERRLHDWMYFAEPEDTPTAGASNAPAARSSAAARRSTRWPMSAAIAATTTVGRGRPRTWSYAHVLPYFRRQEFREGGAGDYRGGDGPLTVRRRVTTTRSSTPALPPVSLCDIRTTDDYNGAQQEGLGGSQRRSATAGAAAPPSLSAPGVGPPNLKSRPMPWRTASCSKRSRAVGVEYLTPRRDSRDAHAEREVILAGGVINSPQLLMLSGIGDPERLAARHRGHRAACRASATTCRTTSRCPSPMRRT